MLTFDIKGLITLVENGEYEAALDQGERFVSLCLTSFMEELTVDSATSFAGATLLYAQICAAMKKPWLAVPKLDSAKGALRFMKDFMTDTDALCQTYESFANAYVYARFYPEAVECFEQIAKFSDKKEVVLSALKECYFYQSLFGKNVISEEKVWKDKLSKEELALIISDAEKEAENQILTDPVEHSDEFLLVRFDVEAKVDKALSMPSDDQSPYCVRYWSAKQRILKEEFSIDWQTPAQMNPNIRFY